MNEILSLVRRHLSGTLRYKWVAVALAWLISLVGWIGVSNMPDRFQANARVYIDADAVLTPLLHGLALESPLSAQIEVLQRTLLSRPNLEKLIAKTDLSLRLREPSDLERMVAALGTEISVVPQTRGLFTITYQDQNPKLAFDVVQTILNIFVEDKAGTSRNDMANARTFVDQQITNYEQQLRTAEQKRATFRAQYMELLPAEGSGLSKLDAARDTTRRLEGDLADAQSRHDRLTKELAGTPQTLVTETDPGTPGSAGGNPAVAAAEAHLRELLTTLTDQNPDVIHQRQLITALKAGGATTATGSAGRPARSRSEPNPVFQQLKVMLVQADTDVASLTRQVNDATKEQDRLEQSARSMPTVQAQSINLNRDYDMLRKNYDELISRREAMRLSSAADTEADKVKLQVIDPPQIPQVPVGPKRKLLLTGVLGAALAGGVAAAFLLAQTDTSYHTVGELALLGIPIVGSISMVTSTKKPGVGWRALNASTAVAMILLLAAIYGGLMYGISSKLRFI